VRAVSFKKLSAKRYFYYFFALLLARLLTVFFAFLTTFFATFRALFFTGIKNHLLKKQHTPQCALKNFLLGRNKFISIHLYFNYIFISVICQHLQGQ